jgi:hypothetical protein
MRGAWKSSKRRRTRAELRLRARRFVMEVMVREEWPAQQLES